MIKAAGRMGWTSDQFWFSTPSFFYAAFAGHMEQERDRFHQNLAASRIVAYYAFAPHMREGANLKMSDIVRLPGDEDAEPQFEAVSEDELKQFNEMSARGYEAVNGVSWQQ